MQSIADFQVLMSIAELFSAMFYMLLAGVLIGLPLGLVASLPFVAGCKALADKLYNKLFPEK